MKTLIHHLLLFLAVCLLPALALTETPKESAIAYEWEQCRDIVKECFLLSGHKKANCFYAKSQHSFCSATELGDLIFKRWSYSNSQPAGSKGMALLGPQMIDAECLERFDHKFSTALLDENLRPGTASLHQSLDACKEEIVHDYVRP